MVMLRQTGISTVGAVSIYERPEWTSLRVEEALDPQRRIIDAHHHLWQRPDSVYLAPELVYDTSATHNVTHTVFVECSANYDTAADREHAPVGETRFVAAEAERARDLGVEIAGIVGHADLSLGATARRILEAHIEAGQGLFRGVRHGTNWSQHDSIKNGHHGPTPGLMKTDSFVEAVGLLGSLGLTFDAWLYFDQLGELADVADANPETTVVCDHLGGPLGIGPWSGAGRLAMLETWEAGIARLSQCANVVLKISGLGMEHYFGTGWASLPKPPSSNVVAEWWSEIVHRAIEHFGPDRCMFASNYPVDRQTLPYSVLWNALQRLAGRYDEAEQQALFSGTAARTYRIA